MAFDHVERLRAAIDLVQGNGFCSAPAEDLQALINENERQRVELVLAMDQFEFYERNHRAKGTPDADQKADVNRDMAARIKSVLSVGALAPIDSEEGGRG